MTHNCPRCGRSFESRRHMARVTCHQCGTSWNTGSRSSTPDWLCLIIAGMLTCLCCPPLGTIGLLLILGGCVCAYFHFHKD